MEEESRSPNGGSSSSLPFPHPPLVQTLPNPSPSSSIWPGFAGIGFAFLFLARSHSRFKPLSTGIKLADGVVHGFKALYLLRSPSPQSIIFASKAVVKGYKISKHLYPRAAAAIAPPIPPAAAKQLKGFVGVVNLVRYAFVGGEGFGFLKIGYKMSKNFAKVLEGFVGLQLDSALRNGIDACGLLVKAMFVWRELGQCIASKFPSNNRLEYRLLVGADSRYAICLSCKRSNFDQFCAYVDGFALKKPPLSEEPLDSQIMPLKLYHSDLLSLAIPLHEVFSMSIL